MTWKQILDETLKQIEELRLNLYPDKSWKYDDIPSRKELKLFYNLTETLEKDFTWIEEYKNPKKKVINRKIRIVEIKPELGRFMRLKERGLDGYPENYILLFHVHYLYYLGAISGNKVDTSKFNDELKMLYPELTGVVNLIKFQSVIKKYIIIDESGKRKILEYKNEFDDEIKCLKELKEVKNNIEDFNKRWNDYFEFKK